MRGRVWVIDHSGTCLLIDRDKSDSREHRFRATKELNMKTKFLAVGLSLAMLLCVVALLFRAVLFSSDPPDGKVAAGGAASQRSARSSVHRPVDRAIEQPAAQLPEPTERTSREPPPAAAAPLTPDLENARLRKILDDSGGAAGDALDRTSHDIASDLVGQLRARDAQVNLQAVECRAAGCTATLEVAAEADYFRLHDLVSGIDPRSALARWPGPRIMPPVLHRDGKLVLHIMLIRPDARAQF